MITSDAGFLLTGTRYTVRVMGLTLAFFLLFSASLTFSCDGGKILVFPIDGSHWLNMKVLVKALHARGHEITVIRTSTSWYITESSQYYTSITIHQEQSQQIESQTHMSAFLQRSLDIRRRRGTFQAFVDFYKNIFELLWDNHRDFGKMVTSIFENETLVKQLNDTGYDVCLTDPVFPGGVLIAHYLKLPMVFNVRWIFDGDGHFAIAPSPLSFVPQLFSHCTDKMDFFQRLMNVVSHYLLVYMYHYISNPPYQAVCDRYFEPGINIKSILQSADIWLMRVDFTFEFPRPTMPNVVYMGGFQGQPSKPLPADLEEFVQSAGEHGVVIMTLGTLLGDLGPELSEIFASAFANLPQKVIWRHIGEKPSTLANNTMLVKWLPQDDLLGHPQTKLFVTHGGTNGLFEAIYHGVPVLGVPLIFDQFDNVVRMQARGVAEMVEVTDIDVESLTNALKNILDPKKPYKQNMVKLSKIHHDKPIPPIESAVFWTEYVMRHKGAAHLRTESYKLPWYVYHSLDVMAFLVAFGFLIIMVMWISCRCLIGCFIKKKTSNLKSKKE